MPRRMISSSAWPDMMSARSPWRAPSFQATATDDGRRTVQRLTITEDRVCDYFEIGSSGMTTPSVTNLVAIDYGMDI